MPAPTTPLTSHVQHTPPAVTETEAELMRWEDDGAPPFEIPPGRLARQWLRVSAELSTRLAELAGRDDVIVTCAPGTRSGAPAAFFPALAQLEIDAALFAPHPPATLHPAKVGDEERYPAAWGAFTHEAAHAAHTRWTIPPALRGTAQGQAAELLEEARAEGAQLRRRPADRRYLRASALGIIVPNFQPSTVNDRWAAATAAALLLARRDAGILDPDETADLEKVVRDQLGDALYAELAAIWQAVQQAADDDGPQMTAHAEAWCQALGAQPTGPEPPPIPGGGGTLAEAVGRTVEAVAAQEEQIAAAQAAHRAQKEAKAEQAERARQGAELGKKVFARPGRPQRVKPVPGRRAPSSPVTRRRLPSGAEKAAASRLARALKAAAYRERVTTVTRSATPPGRLNMRQVLARDAQRAAGATPTATPFTRTEHRPTPSPPLRVGIAVDISGSMCQATAPIASAAWILARATSLTDPDSRSATIAYDRHLTAITAPGRAPTQVAEFNAHGLGHSLAEAADILTATLNLDRPGAARLLVIASDGHYAPGEAARAHQRITTLRAAGCAVLWLAFEPGATPLPGATFLELTDPAQAITAIATAATHALAHTT
ncbi:vWA domain-containing protein [Streptomyces sp. NPDC050095]|uniref:vWA domain-containing protein n=1 Tax=unclassified Streptomyces TaxID=2593676 RepID=UPI003418BCA5